MFQRHLNGFFRATSPASEYSTTRNRIDSATPVPITFTNAPISAPTLPAADISRIIEKM